MSGFMHWLAMGGYAAYVWSAYGVALIVLSGLAVSAISGYRASRRALDELEAQGRTRR
ncbi:MAG TPA: heme exporter protein CcmD [Stellaceae bacterium]|jgi:heme exporter protein D|nr:heme exporter protein CcmD [Stellaceae bacterium]